MNNPQAAENADRLAAALTTTDPSADFDPPLADVVTRTDPLLAFVGPPRSGRSLFAAHYAQAALRARAPGDPVPLPLSLNTWYANRSVRSWLLSAIAGLAPSVDAEGLLTAGLVVPVVDGVDELDPSVRPDLVRELEELGVPVRLTTLPEHAPPWPTVELRPPTVPAVLRQRGWDAVADEVRDHPDGSLATALQRPFARAVADWAGLGDGPDLVTRARDLQPDEVERLLLERLSPAQWRDLRTLGRLGQTGEEVEWWRLPALTMPRRLTTFLGVGVGLVGGSGVGGAVADRGPVVAIVTGVVATLLLSAVFVLVVRCRPPKRMILPRWWCPVAGAVVGTAGALLTTWWSVLAGVVGAVAAALVLTPAPVRPDAPLRLLRWDRSSATLRAVVFAVTGLALVGTVADVRDDDVASFWLVCGVVGLLSTAYGPYLLCGWWLAAVGGLRRDVVGVLEEAGAFVRREGPRYRFRDEAVRARLVALYAQDEHLTTVDSARTQLVVLRDRLVEEACARVDVRGVLEEDELARFGGRVYAEFDRNVAAIAATGTASRRRYVAAKSVYVRRCPPPMPPLLWTALAGMSAFGFALLAVTLPARTSTPPWVVVAGAVAVVVLLVLGWWRDFPRRRPAAVDRLRWWVCGGLIVGAAVVNAGTPVPDWQLWVYGVYSPLVPVVWVLSRSVRERWDGWLYDDPDRWPPEGAWPWAAAARQEAVRAHDKWVDALVDQGVVPLVAALLEGEGPRSYALELPEVSVARLGDVTDPAQYVATGTSAWLARRLRSMSRGAIGIGGPRGVGKSAVLTLFGELRFGARQDDVTVSVSAPTDYGSRDFLVHLFARVCEEVLADAPAPGRKSRRWVWWLVGVAGALVAAGAWRWSWVAGVAARGWSWVPGHVREVVVVGGLLVAVSPVVGWVWSRVRRRPVEGVVEVARRHLEALRFLETTTVTRSVTAKPPAVAEFGGQVARQRAAQARTFPELVDDFREFLEFLVWRTPGARVVVCVDELDKIGSGVEAERFLNDIKAVFGVQGCFFLVAVSDDAMASFSRGSLAVRTVFDSAFDRVVTVRRFELGDTRRLLVRRVSRLPEPFVWLCHVLSGGLPRDLNRVVWSLHDLHTAGADLPGLARELVRQDVEAVTEALLVRLADAVDGPGVRLRQWVVEVPRLGLTSAAFAAHREVVLYRVEADELRAVHEQARAYLHYAAAVLRVFGEDPAGVAARLAGVADERNPLCHLARARARLAWDPVSGTALVDDFRRFERIPVRH
ncbi:hypothetical protein [Actinosynnema sp. NPDC020468]|uniref:hypothetical protein n=1 Tax=Actinosynnema sp. NPDC020468 TaxID=3154488 RepID=UPI0034056EA4